MKNVVYQDQFGKTGNCFAACLASLFGWELRTIPDFFGVTSEDWWANVRAFLKEKGYGIFTIGYCKEWLEKQEGYFIVSGKSQRELTHAVIYHKGKMFHDPHPDGTGIEPSDVDIIYKTFEDETTFRQALTEPQVDVDGLKAEQRRYFNAYDPSLSNALYNHGDALIDYLAARGLIGNASQWQPIETAPRDGEAILLRKDNRVYAGAWDKQAIGYKWVLFDPDTYSETNKDHINGWKEQTPTHWMPLLPPPNTPATSYAADCSGTNARLNKQDEPVDAQERGSDFTKCPSCGGEADNGHDRCYPPNVYNCTKCEE